MASPIISVMEHNGNAVQTDKTSSIIRFKQADDAAVNTADPLSIPTVGNRLYSYEKWLRLRIGVGSPAQQLSNIRFYTDGSNSFGGNAFLFGEDSASHTFRSASQLNASNNPPQGGSGSRTMTTVFRLTANAALSLTSAAETYSGTSTDIGRFVVLVMRVDPGITPGTLPVETLSFGYDESAIQTTADHAFAVSLDGLLSHSAFTKTTTFDGYIGGAGDDGPYAATTGQDLELFFDDLLNNDFVGCSATPTITLITGLVNCSATAGTFSVTVTPLVSGTAAFHYITLVGDQFDTGSVAIAASDFGAIAGAFPFYTLIDMPNVVEQRTGAVRATGIDINKQIVSYGSGQERFTIDLSSGVALGLMVEDTGENRLANSALSGVIGQTPTSWLTIAEGARSATASIMGFADQAWAWKQVAEISTVANPTPVGARPFLGQTLTTWSTSVTFVASMTVESYIGNPGATIMGIAGFASATGTLQMSAGQLTSVFPQRLSMAFVNINSAVAGTTGSIRYGMGINLSSSGTIIISRPSVEQKKGRLSFSPDTVRNPDMPIVTISHSASATYFPFSTAAGSFVIQAKTAPAQLPGSQILLQIDDGTGNNMHQFFRNNSGDIVYKVVTAGVQQARFAGSGVSSDTTFRLEASYASNDVRYTLNSNQIYTTAVATMPLGLGVMRIGHDHAGQTQWNGTIAEINVFRTPSDNSTLPPNVPTTVPIPDLGPILTNPQLLQISDPGTYNLTAGTDYRVQFTSSGPILGRVWIIGGRKVHVGWGPTKSDYGGQIIETGDGVSCLIVENMEQECWIEGMYCDKQATHGHCFQVRCSTTSFPVWVLNCYADGALPVNTGGGGSALSNHDGTCPKLTVNGFVFRTYGTGIGSGGGKFTEVNCNHVFGHYGSNAARLIGTLYALDTSASMVDAWAIDDTAPSNALSNLVAGDSPTTDASGNLNYSGAAYRGQITKGSAANQFSAGNVGLSYIQPGYTAGGGVDTGGGTGGGGGGGGGNTVPAGYYGSGHLMAGLGNTSLGPSGRRVSHRFFCPKDGVITGVMWYMIGAAGSVSCTDYGKYQGASGYGGTVRVRIYNNNPNAGAGGTAANVPSTILPGTFNDLDAHAWNSNPPSGFSSVFPEQSGGVNVSSSTIYHLVFTNLNNDGCNNYVSPDDIHTTNDYPVFQPMNPAFPDAYDRVLYAGAGGTWKESGKTDGRDYCYIGQFRMADGSVFGNPWVESIFDTKSSTAPDQGEVYVGGATQVRQTFMPHSTMTVSQFNMVSKGTPASPLVVTTRRQSNNFLVDTTTVPTSRIRVSSQRQWLSNPVDLAGGPMILSSSVTYTMTLTSSNTPGWMTGGIRQGSQFDDRIGVSGYLELSTNAGGSWTSWLVNGGRSKTNGATLMWYYTRTG